VTDTKIIFTMGADNTLLESKLQNKNVDPKKLLVGSSILMGHPLAKLGATQGLAPIADRNNDFISHGQRPHLFSLLILQSQTFSRPFLKSAKLITFDPSCEVSKANNEARQTLQGTK
jgi:hypothetical protein